MNPLHTLRIMAAGASQGYRMRLMQVKAACMQKRIRYCGRVGASFADAPSLLAAGPSAGDHKEDRRQSGALVAETEPNSGATRAAKRAARLRPAHCRAQRPLADADMQGLIVIKRTVAQALGSQAVQRLFRFLLRRCRFLRRRLLRVGLSRCRPNGGRRLHGDRKGAQLRKYLIVTRHWQR